MIQAYNILFMNNHNMERIKIWYNSFTLKYCDYVLVTYIYTISLGLHLLI